VNIKQTKARAPGQKYPEENKGTQGKKTRNLAPERMKEVAKTSHKL